MVLVRRLRAWSRKIGRRHALEVRQQRQSKLENVYLDRVVDAGTKAKWILQNEVLG